MGFRLYYIAIIPHQELTEEVKKIKEDFAERFSSSKALRSPAHITLQPPFNWEDARENAIIESLEAFCKGEIPFKVQLNNFSQFGKKTLFIDVVKENLLLQLHKNLTTFLHDKLNLNIEDHSGFHPHMTVAFRDLKPEMFLKAWNEFKDKTFQREFEVHSICLLKHNGKSWDVLKEVLF